MGLEVGIVGLPNVGKSTLFKCITSSKAEAANYPFCTIDPNVGIASVPDSRLDKLEKFFNSESKIYNILKMIDIAGLVEGASKGEGRGNQFLSEIRRTDAIAHVVRCFDDDQIIHVSGKVDPIKDIEVINTELILADLDQVEKRTEHLRKMSKGRKDAAEIIQSLEKLNRHLTDFNLAGTFEVASDFEEEFKQMNLITAKKMFFVLNVAEEDLAKDSDLVRKVIEYVESKGMLWVKVCCELEAQLTDLEGEEKEMYLEEMGVTESGLGAVIRQSFALLDQITFFTAGKVEARAWNTRKGSSAPEAAGKIHSDIQRGFIKAEVYDFDALEQYKSEQALKEAGKIRLEGKDYIVREGDVIYFRFNV